MTMAVPPARDREALARIPAPGCGCHPFLLAVANHGVAAKIHPQAIFSDIRGSIPAGNRYIPDSEIMDAINKALADHQGGTFMPRPKPQPAVRDGQAALQAIMAQATILTEADLWEASPIRLLDRPQDDPALLLSILYQPTDLLWIGERHEAGIMGVTIRTAGEWAAYSRAGGKTAPHVIPNPLDGIPRPKKTGDGSTLRGDANVQRFRFAVVEFDGLSRDEQLRFWCSVKLPIVVLIDSGGKSIHGWVDVAQLASVATADAWGRQIKDILYDRLLVPLGVDPACSNPARLSRLPGHFRREKNGCQRILWLSATGRPIR